ncbi:FAD-dependent monooxygenase [Terrimicrobium sacchariphilum]|nr:FAD-dependent monooxygenase [Terrimicrobium sacchariphilum]
MIAISRGMDANVDVLVVGAGPVGLLLATELVRDGVKALSIDAMTGRTFFSKALGITPRTLEIFDDLGVLHDAIDRGVWIEGVSAFANGEFAGGMDIPEELPFGSLSLAQYETERVLERGLQRHGGRVHYGWALTDFRETADCVEAALTGPGGETRSVACRWLVGCDGAHSRVRSSLGVAFEGGRYPQTFTLADLEVEWDLPHNRMYRFNLGEPGQPGGRILAAVPVYSPTGKRFRLSTVIPEVAGMNEQEFPAPSLAEVIELMSPLLPAGTKLSSLHWSSVYRVSHRIAAEYSRGRAFLAGDAAHIHPPVGGQGMNTGLQDAHNLAWKLSLAARGLAAPSLLETYEEERRPVGLDVVENTSRAMAEVLDQRHALPGLRETQLLIAYRDSSIVCDERGDTAPDAPVVAGDRAPDAGPLQRCRVAQPFRLHELTGKGRHLLLGYFAETATGDFALLLDVLNELPPDFTSSYAILAQGGAASLDNRVPCFVDVAGKFAAEYGATPGMAWLIRPDGHVGWCSTRPTVTGLREYLRRIVAI